MLQRLLIQNIALIDRIDLEFGNSFNIVTGETGTGKTIIVKAISLLKGDRLQANTIKTGAQYCAVEGEFALGSLSSEIREILNTVCITTQSQESIVLRREIPRNGRQRHLINDQIINKAHFREIGALLMDINSQHESQKLLYEDNYIHFFDSAINVDQLLSMLSAKFHRLNEISSQIKQCLADQQEQNQRRQLIKFQIDEIDAAGLKPGEKENLIQRQQRLQYAETIFNDLNISYDELTRDDMSLTDMITSLYRRLNRVAEKDNKLKYLFEEADRLSITTHNLTEEIRKSMETIVISPDDLEQVSARLYFLQTLEGKYGNDVDGLIRYRKDIETELHSFRNHDKNLEQLKRNWTAVFEEYIELDQKLSKIRRDRAKKIAGKIENELAALSMSQARFEISFSPKYNHNEVTDFELPKRCTSHGTDVIRFLLSANPGIPAKPLSEVASGGELSRIMLALKRHFCSNLRYMCIVFDEIDAGIGGKTAKSVGIQLKELADQHQVICITHLAQIAVCADSHFAVRKEFKDKNTIVSIKKLNSEDRVYEVARMIAGNSDEDEAIQHAKALLSNPSEISSSITNTQVINKFS